MNSLIEAAEQGVEVMILCCSRPALRLLKVTEADLHFNPEIWMKGLEEFDLEIGKDRRDFLLLYQNCAPTRICTQVSPKISCWWSWQLRIGVLGR